MIAKEMAIFRLPQMSANGPVHVPKRTLEANPAT